jgi:hypothetical protein
LGASRRLRPLEVADRRAPASTPVDARTVAGVTDLVATYIARLEAAHAAQRKALATLGKLADGVAPSRCTCPVQSDTATEWQHPTDCGVFAC